MSNQYCPTCNISVTRAGEEDAIYCPICLSNYTALTLIATNDSNTAEVAPET